MSSSEYDNYSLLQLLDVWMAAMRRINNNNNNSEDDRSRTVVVPSSGNSLTVDSAQSIMSRRRSSVMSCNSKRPIKLQNIVSGQISVDTLHQSTLEVTGCHEKLCVGSLMNWKHQAGPSCSAPRSSSGIRDRDQVIEAAKSFFDQYYLSIKRLNSPAHELRWKEVVESIESDGTYDLRETELIFGAKLAWRNAPRCIGRIQWSKLQVFDFRHVTSAREMFEAICNHIKYATNRGNLRSAITVFPARKYDVRNDFRVWNAQLISYAGYVDPKDPNHIIGDPLNVEFTQLCEKLGWTSARTRWDILPLILTANGQDPQVFVIPDELVLRIPLTHPRFEWWKEMNLEWYALPAVSGMLLDVGGIEFPASPFSGWYMVTEIAMRDLCDPQRYNILEDVAQKMGLDTRTNASLWKDAASVEINISVLDSFQKAGVTIVDHHTASESFMKHLENEQRLRGGCPADWVWVVPPTAASLTPVYHQEMLYYNLKPSYEYQEPAMKTHVWKNVPGSDTSDHSLPVRKIRFKEIAKAVKFTSNLFGKALSKRIKATILFATETGKSELYAKRLAQIFSHAFNVSVMCMDSYDTFNLEHEALLLIVTSTFGNGDPPENGETFARQLQAIKVTGDTTPDIESIRSISMSYLRVSESVDSIESTSLAATNMLDTSTNVGQVGPLSNIRFAVFALGSSAYPNFCAYGRFLDNTLYELGGERIIKLGTGDELCGQEQAFTEWAKRVFQESGDVFCITDEVNMSEVINSASLRRTTWTPSDVKLQVCKSATTKFNISKSLSMGSNRKVIELKMLKTENLYECPDANTRRTIKVSMKVNECPENFNYLPGDHLGLFAENSKELVEKLAKRLSKVEFDVEVNVLLKKQNTEPDSGPFGLLKDKSEEWEPIEKFSCVTVRNTLTRLLDITTPPTQQFLGLLSCFCSDDVEREKLNVLSTDSSKYENWKAFHFPTFYEVLQLFPSLEPPAEFILTQLPALQPRFYSISSSPLYTAYSSNNNSKSMQGLEQSSLSPDHSLIELTVAVVSYKTQSGSQHFGICSNFLSNCPTGHLMYGFIRSAPNFRLPDSEELPVIMTGPGTGIAPFRGFWLQRLASKRLNGQSKKFGPMSLFFGCRIPLMQLYREEIEEMKKQGVLNEVFVAFSRCENLPKKYVQDFMLKKSEMMIKHLVHQKGHFYVCGDVSMAEDVCKTLKSILQQNGIEDPDVALIKLRESMRFHEDIFGITLRTAEVTRKGRKEALSKRSISRSFSNN